MTIMAVSLRAMGDVATFATFKCIPPRSFVDVLEKWLTRYPGHRPAVPGLPSNAVRLPSGKQNGPWR